MNRVLFGETKLPKWDIVNLDYGSLEILSKLIIKFMEDELIPTYNKLSRNEEPLLNDKERTIINELESEKTNNVIIATLTKSRFEHRYRGDFRIPLNLIISTFFVEFHLMYKIEDLQFLVELAKLASTYQNLKKYELVVVSNQFDGYQLIEIGNFKVHVFHYMEIFQNEMYLASDFLLNKIFIFNHIRFEHLYYIFRNKGIVINGGSHNRRHILKTNDIKLTLVLRTLLFLIENLTYPRKPFKFEDYDSRLIELSHKSFASNQFKKKRLYWIKKSRWTICDHWTYLSSTTI
uniref:Uncharacterized protein n=1 Tax=Ganoderma tsugae TaxID=2075311 RepID=A0A2S1WB94_GANTS|nr:hypothetical protein [Ganoderma tsugae]AWJ63853.1 hypothetical protein [Ganoderma tsugae]